MNMIDCRPSKEGHAECKTGFGREGRNGKTINPWLGTRVPESKYIETRESDDVPQVPDLILIHPIQSDIV